MRIVGLVAPLSALILNQEGYRKITAKLAGLITFFAEPGKPSCLDGPSRTLSLSDKEPDVEPSRK